MPRELIEPRKGGKRYIRRGCRAIAFKGPAVESQNDREEGRGRPGRPSVKSPSLSLPPRPVDNLHWIF
jgi:hypothetical protein